MRYIGNIIGHLHPPPPASSTRKMPTDKTTEAYLSKYFLELYLNDSIDGIDVLYTDALPSTWTTTMKKFQWSISFRVNVWWIEITWWWIIFDLFVAQLGAIHFWEIRNHPFHSEMAENDFHGNDASNENAKLKSYQISRREKSSRCGKPPPIHTRYINRLT